MKKVSVIIPTYNRADKIHRAILSVLNQTYENLEIIIVDDCSTDNTESIVKSIQDERVSYFKLETNKGAAGARNYGVSVSKSEYVAFHDSDDEWLPGKLARQIEYMQKNPHVGMVYGKMHIIRQNQEGDFPSDIIQGKLEGYIYHDLLKRNTIGAPTMLIRRECFDKIGGFDSSLRCLEDWEFAIRFSRNYQIGYIDEPLIVVHSEAGGVSSNTSGYYEARCRIVAQHRETMERLEIFDEIVLDIFSRAQATGVLNQVQTILMKFLSK